MLSLLRIKNLALVEDLKIAFDAGLNVLTGETGAGKSILVNAVGLALGQRADALLVRKGEEQASVEAAFSIPNNHFAWNIAREAGLDIADGEDFLLRRVVSSSGKSRSFANDQAIALSTLERIAGTLVDLVGQHSHQSLLKEESHLELLDAFGRHQALREELARAFQTAKTLEDQLAAMAKQEQDKQEKLDFYRFQNQEIAKAALIPGEEEELEREYELLSGAQKWQELSASVLESLYEGEDSLFHRASVIQSQIAQAKHADAGMEEAAKNMQEALALLKESAECVRRFGDRVASDPQRLALVQERLMLIGGLKRKYHRSAEDLIAWGKDLQEKIAALENLSVEKTDVEARLEKERQGLKQVAAKLTKAREAAAEKLAGSIRAQWQDLGMEGAGLRIELESCPVHAKGAENIRFLVAPNKGEGFKPLAAIASGGEISRILLAIKIVLSAIDSIPTLVFDEVDANIGGAVATMVGKKLRELSAAHQILAITHLPQIAHQAKTHFVVSKEMEMGRTVTRIRRLDEIGRPEELVRMMGGKEIARELLR